MAYNLKSDVAAYHVKLTTIGRKLMAQGILSYGGFLVGDSEVDYTAADATSTALTSLRVLRPVDAQPAIKYPVIARPGVSGTAPLFGVVADQVLIRNSAPSRGPFRKQADGTENVLDTSLPVGPKVSFVTDRCNVQLAGTSTVTTDKTLTAQPGDWLLVHAIHPHWTPAVAPQGDGYLLDPAVAGLYLLYRIVSVSGTTVVVDRPLPGGNNPTLSPAFVLPGGNALETIYGVADAVLDWDEDQLAFVAQPPVATAQVGLWNCSILYGEGVMGSHSFPWGSYPSNAYGGTRRYLGYGGGAGAIAVLHYSNHVVHNLYGEGLVPATVTINLPSVLWWGNTTGGGGLVATTDPTRQALSQGAPTHTLIYHNLLDPLARVIGRVFPALKIVVLDDSELVAALSAKSNRNWTLPAFESASAGGVMSAPPVAEADAASAALTPGQRALNVTYALESDGVNGYALNSALPCQYKTAALTTVAALPYYEFKLTTGYLQHLQDETTMAAAMGGGYTAERIVLLFQETALGTRPSADAWVRLDVTAQAQPAGGALLQRGSFANIIRVDGQKFRDAFTAAQTSGFYTLPALGPAGGLSFGEETVLLGNVRTDIEARVFRTSFLLSLGDGEYATSSNPTWSTTNPVAITEIGIYDTDAQLVASGKLTDPLIKSAQGALFLEVSLDF